MLKNLWKTRITRGGWFPTSTIDPHGIHEGTRKSFCQDTATPWYSCQVPWTSLSVCYTLRIDRVTRRASSRDLSSQNKTTSPLLFNPGAAWCALVSILFSYKIVIHVCEFVLSIFFLFFFFISLRILRRPREKASRSRRVRVHYKGVYLDIVTRKCWIKKAFLSFFFSFSRRDNTLCTYERTLRIQRMTWCPVLGSCLSFMSGFLSSGLYRRLCKCRRDFFHHLLHGNMQSILQHSKRVSIRDAK